MSIPFYDFPSSPILIIGALGIAVAIAFFLSLTKYISILLWTQSLKKDLIKEQKELNERLLKIEQDLKNLWNK